MQFRSAVTQQVASVGGRIYLKLNPRFSKLGLALICLVALGHLLLSSLAISKAQDEKRNRGSFTTIEPNHYSPNLYSENLSSKFTLINMPGASQPGSFWELEYEVYFVSEAAFRDTMRRLVGPGGSANPQASDFKEKILLRRGKFKVTRLSSLTERTRLISPIAFKAKVPDPQRTKAANLITSYSVKVYDASLKKTIYDAGLWFTKPFETDSTQPDKAIQKTTLYANFFVSPKGDLFKSQWARTGTDTNW